jgi:NAD(P)-dependent dehydrogenase (short-subunit alcohol dehydrogenase family)
LSNVPVSIQTSNQTASQAEAEQLAGKSILVTGGASGLGAALCHVLSSSGARVVVGDIHLEKAQTVASLLDSPTGSKAHAIGFNVGDPIAAERAIDETVDRFGKLDILINNAGTDVTCPIEELSYNDWDRVVRTNLYGPFLLSKYAARHMKGGGQIINIASTAAKRAWPNASAYHASKWGLLGLSHALHAELRPKGIKVTAVIAGGMRTPFLLDRFPDIDVATLQDPMNVAKAIKGILLLPAQTVVPEVMVLPMQETSWP